MHVKLQPNALSIKLSDQVEQLDELITTEGDGRAFFEKTHITQGMQDLISEGLARLAGTSSQAVFHLKQAMGGGKTHLLVGFGLLARHPELRKTYCGGIPQASAFEVPTLPLLTAGTIPIIFFGARSRASLAKATGSVPSGPAVPRRRTKRTGSSYSKAISPFSSCLTKCRHTSTILIPKRWETVQWPTLPPAPLQTCSPHAGKKKNVCVVVSDLSAAYDTGAKLIHRALEDARSELGRQERNITPVDLAANEIYDILRKRLFKSLPDKAEIEDIAAAFGRKLEEAAKSKTASRGAEAIADEIEATYPFHPRLKNVIALFKENEQFKQTRGLIELVSRLLKSVWERSCKRYLSYRSSAFRSFDCRGPRQTDRDFRHAGCDRQGSLGCTAIRPCSDYRSCNRKRGRHSSRGAASFRQPVNCGKRGQGADPGRNGRMPGLTAAGAVGISIGL